MALETKTSLSLAGQIKDARDGDGLVYAATVAITN